MLVAALNYAEFRAATNPTWCMIYGALNHAMNHVRFMISPELHVVQDKVHGSHEPYVVRIWRPKPCKV